MKFNKLKLATKIQKIKELVKELKKFEENSSEIETMSYFLKFMASMFEDVEQRLTKLENKLSQ